MVILTAVMEKCVIISTTDMAMGTAMGMVMVMATAAVIVDASSSSAADVSGAASHANVSIDALSAATGAAALRLQPMHQQRLNGG